MQRVDNEVAAFMSEVGHASKRARYESPSSDDTMDHQPLKFATTSPPPSEPLLATMASGKQVVVPRPTLPISIQDIDEFLYNFTIFKGLADPPGDFDKAQDAMLAVLTKWNSIYTIKQDPHAESAEAMGTKVGSNLAIRVVIVKQHQLLKPLHDYFETLNRQAETNLRQMTTADMEDYGEHGHISWYYLQLMQRRFARQAKYAIIEVSRKESLRQEEIKRVAKVTAEVEALNAKLRVDLEAGKAVENHGRIVFGSGGGARGGFDFNMEAQMSDEFTFKTGGSVNFDGTS